MRKKGPAGVPDRKTTSRRFQGSEELVALDVLHARFISLEKASKLEKGVFKVQASLQEGAKSFILEFHALRHGSGIQARNKLLYTAPSEGYEGKLTFIVPIDGKTTETFVYYREPGAVTSRLELTLRTKLYPSTGEKELYVASTVYTNPAGLPSLEYDPEVNFEAREKARSR